MNTTRPFWSSWLLWGEIGNCNEWITMCAMHTMEIKGLQYATQYMTRTRFNFGYQHCPCVLVTIDGKTWRSNLSWFRHGFIKHRMSADKHDNLCHTPQEWWLVLRPWITQRYSLVSNLLNSRRNHWTRRNHWQENCHLQCIDTQNINNS
jgi:hypothetical protein